MTYQPVVPLSGYAGWKVLQRTMAVQKEAFVQSATVKRATEYFAENIGKVTTAEELVADRRLLEVALGAYGLEDDIYAKAFVKKVLDDGVLDSDALANKLSDKRYAAFSKAFGFGDYSVANTQLSDFADKIIDRYTQHSFEVAVGDVDNNMRMAMNLGTALSDITTAAKTNNGQWYSVMGNTAVRSVFDTAMGFSSSFAAIDVDKQLAQYKAKASAFFGTENLADFTDPKMQEKLIRLYMIRSDASGSNTTSSGSIALTLLQS